MLNLSAYMRNYRVQDVWIGGELVRLESRKKYMFIARENTTLSQTKAKHHKYHPSLFIPMFEPESRGHNRSHQIHHYTHWKQLLEAENGAISTVEYSSQCLELSDNQFVSENPPKYLQMALEWDFSVDAIDFSHWMDSLNIKVPVCKILVTADKYLGCCRLLNFSDVLGRSREAWFRAFSGVLGSKGLKSKHIILQRIGT